MSVRRHHTSPSRSARTLVQLLVVVLVAAVGSVLPAATAHAVTDYGYDISWPQ